MPKTTKQNVGGRPRIGPELRGFKLTVEQTADLDRLVELSGLPRAAVARQLVQQGLEALPSSFADEIVAELRDVYQLDPATAQLLLMELANAEGKSRTRCEWGNRPGPKAECFSSAVLTLRDDDDENLCALHHVAAVQAIRDEFRVWLKGQREMGRDMSEAARLAATVGIEL
jgi:hypothetical protein